MRRVAPENLVQGQIYRIQSPTGHGSIGTFTDYVTNPNGIHIPRFSNVNVADLSTQPHRPRYVIPGPNAYDPRVFSFYESGDTLVTRSVLDSVVPGLGKNYVAGRSRRRRVKRSKRR